MSEKFSIYESPLSDETKVLRRNSLLSSVLCLFIALTDQLPSKFALLGVSFSVQQQEMIGYFILALTGYFFLHFISTASVESSRWVHPFYQTIVTKRTLLQDYRDAFDEEDFDNSPCGVDINTQDKNKIYEAVNMDANYLVTKKLRWLNSLIYVKLIIEIIVPMLIGIWALIEMYRFIV